MTVLAFVQAAAPGFINPQTGIFVLQIVAIIGIFYFFLMRPQQLQRRKHEDALRQLKRGDEIVTAGGLVGEVIHIKESAKDAATAAMMEDRVTIKSGESRLIVERGRIARIVTRTGDASTAA